MTRPAGRALSSAALLLLGACGHRGDPLPPLRRTPPALTEFRLAQRGDTLEVSCRAPRTSMDGVALSRLAVEILWAEGTADLEKAGHERKVPATPGGRVRETLPLPAPGTLVRAAARAVEGGDRGPRTLILALVAQAPLEAPRDLTGRLDPSGIVLEWSGRVPEPVSAPELGALVGGAASPAGGAAASPGRPPRGPARASAGTEQAPPAAAPAPEAAPAAPAEGASAPPPAPPSPAPPPPEVPHGFLVYRRVDSAPYGSPLVDTPTSAASLTDTRPPLGQTACYVVRAAASTSPLIESAPSNEVCLAARDVVAPAAPVGVAVLPRDEGLEVVWTPSPETDLGGYRVYRESETGERTRVAEVPVGTTTWLDTTAEPGLLHRYVVTAVDTAGNESAPSTPAEARRR